MFEYPSSNSGFDIGDIAFGVLTILIICLKYQSGGEQLSQEASLATETLKVDFWSVTVLDLSLVCLFLALQWGEIVYDYSNPRVWRCLIGLTCLITHFPVMHVWRHEN